MPRTCKPSMTTATASASGSRRAATPLSSSNTASARSSAVRRLGYSCPVLDRIRKEATLILAKAKLGTDVVGEAKKARQEAEQAKALGELVPIYLALREEGDDYWSKLRPRSLTEVTRYLTKAWLPLHGEPIDKITRQMVRSRRDEIVSQSGAVSADRAHAALGHTHSPAEYGRPGAS
jgi:hypothetical protein